MMDLTSTHWNYSKFLVHFIISFVNAISIDIHCDTITGNNNIPGVNSTSIALCPTDQTLVSCGIDGLQDIAGTHIERDHCIALGHSDEHYFVRAKARCCSFPSNTITNTSTYASSPGTAVTVSCPNDSILTGCHVYYASGAYHQIRGSFPGANASIPQINLWISTANQCNAHSRSTTEVIAQAMCLSINPSLYTLQCTTKARNYTGDGFGCESGYTMTSGGTFITHETRTLDWYYVDSNEMCYIRADHHAHMYGNAICCKLNDMLKSNKIQTSSFTEMEGFSTSSDTLTSMIKEGTTHAMEGFSDAVIWIVIGLSGGIVLAIIAIMVLLIMVQKNKNNVHDINTNQIANNPMSIKDNVLDNTNTDNVIVLDEEEGYIEPMDTKGLKGYRLKDALDVTPDAQYVKSVNKRVHNNILELQNWLENEVKLPQYFDIFKDNGYESMQIMKEITDMRELKEIGIESMQHQIMILEAIQTWKYYNIKEENRKREGSEWNDISGDSDLLQKRG